MKNVLLLLHDDDGQEGRLQVALDLTRALNGHLTCLDVVVPPVIVPDYYPGPDQLAPLTAAREREAENVARMRRRLEGEDVAWDILEATGDPAHMLKEAAALADVIVVSSRSEAAEIREAARRIVDELAAKSERLVLAVPPGSRCLDVGGRALIAWDDSYEANQVLRAAIPVLQLAGQVTLIDVNRPGDEFAAQDAATYLARHRVHALVVQETSTEPVAETLLAHAHETGTSYIVMGAFGHGRTIEAIFGGVTSAVLRKSEIPVFLHH